MLLLTAQLGEDETGDSPVTRPAILYLLYQIGEMIHVFCQKCQNKPNA